MKNKGISLIEIMIVMAILGILLTIVISTTINSPGVTENRATTNADKWISETGITIKRKSYSHDSDGDGYGSCTVVTQEGEKIYLQCVSGWFQEFTGASGCKEVDTLIKFNSNPTYHR